jgi:hypothetical protein
MPSDILGFIEASSRFFMLWAGMAYARAYVETSTDADVLLQLISKEPGFEDAADEKEWRQLMDKTCSRIASLLPNAITSPFWAIISTQSLKNIIQLVKDPKESEKDETWIPFTPDCNPLIHNAPNKHGLRLSFEQARHGSTFVASVTCDGASESAYTLNMMGHEVSLMWFVISKKAASFVDKRETIKTHGAIGPTRSLALQAFFSKASADHHITPRTTTRGKASGRGKSKRDCTKVVWFSLRTSLSRLHLQCLLIMGHYTMNKTATTVLSSGFWRNFPVEKAWRHYRAAGCHDFSEILCRCLCKNFDHGVKENPAFFRSLTCSELEAVISQNCLETCNNEVLVLKAIIDWVVSKRDTWVVGDEVCMPAVHQHEEGWLPAAQKKRTESHGLPQRGDFVIKTAGEIPHRVRVRCIRISGQHVSYKEAGKVVEMDCGQLYDAARTGMMRLLTRVRYSFVPLEKLRTELTNAEIYHASLYPEYCDFVKKMVEWHTFCHNRQQSEEQQMPRDSYPSLFMFSSNRAGVVDALVRAFTHAEEPEALSDTLPTHHGNHVSTQPSIEVHAGEHTQGQLVHVPRVTEVKAEASIVRLQAQSMSPTRQQWSDRSSIMQPSIQGYACATQNVRGSLEASSQFWAAREQRLGQNVQSISTYVTGSPLSIVPHSQGHADAQASGESYPADTSAYRFNDNFYFAELRACLFSLEGSTSPSTAGAKTSHNVGTNIGATKAGNSNYVGTSPNAAGAGASTNVGTNLGVIEARISQDDGTSPSAFFAFEARNTQDTSPCKANSNTGAGAGTGTFFAFEAPNTQGTPPCKANRNTGAGTFFTFGAPNIHSTKP